MATVTVTRTVDAPQAAVRAVMEDIESFVRAGGFDEVTVEDGQIHLVNSVGLATLELTADLVDSDAVLAYEARESIFETMHTSYRLDDAGAAGTRVEATTTFELDVSLVGELLDATVVSRQRRRELVGQLDYLESAVG